jgi:hypothetical protein
MTNNWGFLSRRQVVVAMLSSGLCLCRLSTSDVQAQSVVLECLIGGGQRSEMVLVDPTRKSIKLGKRVLEAEIIAQSII